MMCGAGRGRLSNRAPVCFEAVSAAFRYPQELVAQVDQEIEHQLGGLDTATAASADPPKRTKASPHQRRRYEPKNFDLEANCTTKASFKRQSSVTRIGLRGDYENRQPNLGSGRSSCEPLIVPCESACNCDHGHF